MSNSQKTILIIEDEAPIQNILKAFLEDAGYRVVLAGDGVDGIARFHECRPDLVLLDLLLPKVSGFAVCEILRQESAVPVIMLTALDDDGSQMKGFDVMTDDYITKPFSMPLVLRRIEAVLRRADGKGVRAADGILRHGELTVNTESYEVFLRGKRVALTVREFEIVRLLMENRGKVFSRDNLLASVWGYDYFGDAKIVNTHIKNIRKKLGGAYIETVRGVGYKIEKEHSQKDQ